MSEYRFTADEIDTELVAVRDRWLEYLDKDAWPHADRMMLMLLFMLIQQHFQMVASLKGTIWEPKPKEE